MPSFAPPSMPQASAKMAPQAPSIVQPTQAGPSTSTGPEKIIALQNFNGEFNFDAKTLSDICKTYQQLQKELGFDNNTIMTVIVAAWLKKYYNTQKFVLIVNKSIAFLKSKSIVFKDIQDKITAAI